MLERLKQILNIRQNSGIPIFEKIDNMFSTLDEDVLRIEIGTDLVRFWGKICKLTSNIRCEMKDELGFILPVIRISENNALQENEYRIIIRGKIVYEGFVVPNEIGIIDDIYENFKNVLFCNFKNILTNELTEKYIESVRVKNSILVWDITGIISTTEIRIILADLLERGKSIKNISQIFEKISEQIFVENKHNYHSPHKISSEIIKQI